jgi:hypothetical protein
MPITYDVDHNLQRVHAVGTGEIRLEDMTAHVTALAGANLLGYAQLLDARGATLMLTAEETRRIVPLIARLREEHGQARTAFIADSDVSFGMARMYATLAADSDSGFMVYRSLQDGAAWLGWRRSETEQSAR